MFDLNFLAETAGSELPLFNIGINAHPPHHHHHSAQQQNPLVAFRGSLDSDNLGGGGGGGLQRQNASRSQRSSLQRRYLAHLHSRGPAILQRLVPRSASLLVNVNMKNSHC